LAAVVPAIPATRLRPTSLRSPINATPWPRRSTPSSVRQPKPPRGPSKAARRTRWPGPVDRSCLNEVPGNVPQRANDGPASSSCRAGPVYCDRITTL
jgi:hypothetical protein